jgi:hypothetical protein
MKLRDAVGEWFSLRAALEASTKVSEAERAAMVRALARAAEHRASAHVLWSHDQPSRALAEAHAGHALLLEADRATRGESGAEDAIEAELPLTNADVTAQHRKLYARLAAKSATIEDALSARARSTKDLVSLRRQRAAWTIVLVLLGCAAVGWLALRRTWRVDGSGSLSVPYRPSRVFDRHAEWEWLLPDGKPGWVALVPSQPVDVHRVLVRNAFIHHRATQNLRVELYRGGQLLAASEHRFARYHPEPEWVTVDVGEAAVDRIRFVVSSWYGAGGGLAEVRVE